MARFVMQDHKDPRAFTIVERYENEGSQKSVRATCPQACELS